MPSMYPTAGSDMPSIRRSSSVVNDRGGVGETKAILRLILLAFGTSSSLFLRTIINNGRFGGALDRLTPDPGTLGGLSY